MQDPKTTWSALIAAALQLATTVVPPKYVPAVQGLASIAFAFLGWHASDKAS